MITFVFLICCAVNSGINNKHNEPHLVAKQTLAGFHFGGNPPVPFEHVPHLIIMIWAYHNFPIRLYLMAIIVKLLYNDIIKYLLTILPLLCGIFSAYSLYVGFETGTAINFFSADDSESSRKYSVDDSPIFYWLNMAACLIFVISSVPCSILLYKKSSKVNNKRIK